MVEFRCKNCGQELRVQDQHSGKRVKCPKCGSVGVVPEKSDKIRFHCASCGQSICVPQIYAGKKGKCPKCKNPVVVPSLKKPPSEGAGTFCIVCSMCDKTIRVPETSRGQTVECPECGSYIETSPGGAPGRPEASIPPTADEDLYEEGSEEYEESEGVDRHLIVVISTVAAVVVVGLIILVVVLPAVLQSSRTQPAERPEDLRTQQQVVDTDSRPQPVTADGQPEEPVSLEDKLYEQTKIAFMSNRNGNYEIYVMNIDGSEQKRLTNSTYNFRSIRSLSWSPDGEKIVFAVKKHFWQNSDPGSGSGHQICVMNADSGELKNLTNSINSHCSDPSWSPDGKKIAFETRSEIYVMNADGSEQKNLTNDLAPDREPFWSPDGKKIAFRTLAQGNQEIYVMNADGSEQKNLTNSPAWDSNPSWSPDGKKIAFQSRRDGNGEIYVMNADGSEQKNLTNDPAPDWEPSWSPDGKKILFRSDRHSSFEDVARRIEDSEIYVMNANGSGQKRLTTNKYPAFPTEDVDAYWSPDGRKIAFTSWRDGNSEIYVMNADGSEQENVTNSPYPSQDEHSAWSPFIMPSVAMEESQKEDTQPTALVVQEPPLKPDFLGSDPRVKLRQKFPPGKYELIQTKTQKSSVAVEGQPATTDESESRTNWYEIDASEPDASGRTSCVATMKRMKSTDSQGYSYDTDKPDSLRANVIEQMIAKVGLNQKLAFEFGQDGQLASVSGLDRLWDSIGEGVASEAARAYPTQAQRATQIGRQVVQQFRQEVDVIGETGYIQSMLGLVCDMMPDQPVGVGAVWHKVTSEKAPFLGNVENAAEYELLEIEPTPGGRIARITFIGTAVQDESKTTQFGPIPMTLKKAILRQKGEIQLNVDTGLMISGRMDVDSKIEASTIVRGRNVGMNLQISETTETTTRPVIGNRESKEPAPLETPEARIPMVSRTENQISGKAAPSFTLRDLKGKRVSLSDFKGKVVILDFWATWCPPCVVEIPHFIALYEQYEDQGFVVVGISVDRKGVSIVESFARKNRINYPILMADGRVQAAYGGIRAIPTTFIIDSAGIIKHMYIGYRDKSIFETAIKALLTDAGPQEAESQQVEEVPSQPVTSVDYFNRGKAYADKSQYDKAISDFNRAIEIDPMYAEAYLYRGLVYEVKDEHEQAILDFDKVIEIENKAIEIEPMNAKAYCNRGTAFNGKGEYDQAILDLNKAIQTNPEYAEAYLSRGSAYNNKSEFDRAILDYTKAIGINPRFDKAYVNRGLTYYNKGQYDRAISDYSKAIEINPGNVLAYNNRGATYNDKGKHDLAISDSNKAIEINPRYFKAYCNRAVAHRNKGAYDLAILDCSKAIEINPRFTGAYITRGAAHNGKGEYDLAISDYDKAIEIDPRDAVAYYNRGNAYCDKGQYDLGISDFSKAIELHPRFARAYYSRALAYHSSKRNYDKTWEDVQKAQSLGVQIPSGFLNALRKASGRQR